MRAFVGLSFFSAYAQARVPNPLFIVPSNMMTQRSVERSIPPLASATIDMEKNDIKIDKLLFEVEQFNKITTTKTREKTLQQQREELKIRLLDATDQYATMKAKSDQLALKAKELEEKPKRDIFYVFQLLRRIIQKMSRSKPSKIINLSQSNGILTSDSFRQMKLHVGIAGEQIIALAEKLALINPTPIPTLGFKNYGGAPPSESKLAGLWKLRFTTAADASFSESKKRGVATTSQVIDAEKGTLTNVVDFEKGKLSGFRVVVEGEPTSKTDLDLSFRNVKILRKSRFPRLFGEFTIWLPSRLIRWFASKNEVRKEKSGPYLQFRYLDDDLRMHTTGQGNWFIQTRLDSF